ncbi:MAG: hypothetical protein MK008_00235 [Bdellovibrionales bacterium]|nr:hypothetical protein [Bdellovibrionales bacterium]
MASVSQVKNFILQNGLSHRKSILCFQNYLHHECLKEQEFTKALVERFFMTVLNDFFWQENKALLIDEIQSLFERLHPELSLEDDLLHLKQTYNFQIVSLEKQKDFYTCLEKHLQKNSKAKIKLIEFNDNLLVLQLFETGELRVQEYSSHFIIKNGELSPLLPVTDLFYNEQLELSHKHLHRVALSEHVRAYFLFTKTQWTGFFTRGYMHQKYHEFQSPRLDQVPDLCSALKKREYHYINMSSDPMYKETVSRLEKTIEFVGSGQPGSIAYGKNTLESAKNIRDQVFPGDKLLSLLITNLEYAILTHSGAGKAPEL